MVKTFIMALTALSLLVTTGTITTDDPPSALASCALNFPLSRVIATAPVIFVGKVTSTRDHAMTALVLVRDVWRGKHVPKISIVGNASPEDYRTFVRGVVYLFVPEAVSPISIYQDNACSATRPYSHALAKYRPRTAHRP